MTVYGITSTGFRRKTFDEILEQWKASVRGNVSSVLALDPSTIEGAIVIGGSDALAELWEQAEISYNGIDRRKAQGDQVVALGKLAGSWREGARKGYVLENVTHQWPTGTTVAAGALQFCEDGNETNSWTNRDPIVVASHSTSGGEIVPVTVQVPCQSTQYGSLAVGVANSLSEIVNQIDGLVAVNNPSDATPGEDIEDIEDLRFRSELEIGRASTTTPGGVRAALRDVDGVSYAVVENNTSDAWYTGIPPHGFRATIWDGTTEEAADASIAEAIYRNTPPGTGSAGTESYVVVADDGEQISVLWDRCEILLAYVSATVYGPVGSDVVKAAIASNAQPNPGQSLYFSSVVQAALAAGCTHCDLPTLGIVASPTTSTPITPSRRQIVLLDTSRIVLTVIS